MTAREILNLIDRHRAQGFDKDKIVECIEATEGKKKTVTKLITNKSDYKKAANHNRFAAFFFDRTFQNQLHYPLCARFLNSSLL